MRTLFYMLLFAGAVIFTHHAEANAQDGLEVVIEARADAPGASAEIAVTVNGREMHRFRADQNWRSYPFVLPAEIHQITAIVVMPAGTDSECTTTGPCRSQPADILIRDVRVGNISGAQQLPDGSIQVQTIANDTPALFFTHPDWRNIQLNAGPDFTIDLAGMQLQGAPVARVWLNNRAIETREIRNDQWAPVLFARPGATEDFLCVEIELLNFAVRQNSDEARDIIVGHLRINADSRDRPRPGRWVNERDIDPVDGSASGPRSWQNPDRNSGPLFASSGMRLGTGGVVWNIADWRSYEQCVELAMARRRNAEPSTRTLIPAAPLPTPSAPSQESEVVFDPDAPIPGESSAEDVALYCNAKRSELGQIQARALWIDDRIFAARQCCGEPLYIDDLTESELNFEIVRARTDRQRIEAMSDDDIIAELINQVSRAFPPDETTMEVWDEEDAQGDLDGGPAVDFDSPDLEEYLAVPSSGGAPKPGTNRPDSVANDTALLEAEHGSSPQSPAQRQAQLINSHRAALLQANTALSRRIEQELEARAEIERLMSDIREALSAMNTTSRLIELHCPR
jgi:hypothetical protein